GHGHQALEPPEHVYFLPLTKGATSARSDLAISGHQIASPRQGEISRTVAPAPRAVCPCARYARARYAPASSARAPRAVCISDCNCWGSTGLVRWWSKPAAAV